jgi:hypothetical protein
MHDVVGTPLPLSSAKKLICKDFAKNVCQIFAGKEVADKYLNPKGFVPDFFDARCNQSAFSLEDGG